MGKVRHLMGIAGLTVGMTVAAVATPAVSSAECDGGRTWDPMERLCDPPPAVPAWYQVAPTYAQPWAPPWAPPPPSPPSWDPQLKPVWDPRLNAWTLLPI
ncbi:MAG: hypothetical protein JO280_18040 [Mycobacteriaceae bacterium]|nr:hypothetical protein [Mycobacteriaceae bacterium]